MTESLNIIQQNVKGFISTSLMTLHEKLNKFNERLVHKQVHIALIQEWSATIKTKINTNETHYKNKHGHLKTIRFPIEYFPNYNVHHIGTECTVLYHKQLNITPLPQTTYCKQIRNTNFHVCGVILHSESSPDIGFYSVYKCQGVNAVRLLDYDFISNQILSEVILTQNILIGEAIKKSKDAEPFINELNTTNYTILNTIKPQYTYISPTNRHKSFIDLTLASDSLIIDKWYVNHAQYNSNFSDHAEIKMMDIPVN